MGSMSSCIGGMNSHSAREVKFNLVNSPSDSLRGNRKLFHRRQFSNSQFFVPIENDEEFITKKNELNNNQNILENNVEKDKILQIENIVNNNLKSNNNNIFKKKLRGRSNNYIKKKKIESSDDYCDIIECEDEFECDRKLSDSGNMKSSDILNEKRVNYLPIQNLIINNIENIKSNAIPKENGGNNGEKQLVIKEYDDKGNKNLKFNNNLFKIAKPNNLSFTESNEINIEKINEKNITKNYFDNINESSKNIDNKDFNKCKIDNNISFNINNSMINTNNNNPLNNNMNNFNNISEINSDFNNNNYIDISSNLTYFLSLEKSLNKPQTTRFDKNNILSLNNKPNMNNKTSSNKELTNNKYRNSVKVNNKFKWKLLPKHKYNTQIYKSIMNIPNIPLNNENQSLMINEEEQKNLNLTNLTPINSKSENSLVFSEIKKQKEEQDKLIKSLENKIKNLEKKINVENMSKIKEKKLIKMNKINNKLAESQKDFRIRKLEEQLHNVKINNKLNKSLLKKKEEQIKFLIEKKNKQDELIKRYEIKKNLKPKNSNHNCTTKATTKEINYLDDISKSNNYNNFITSNSNSNLFESKMSYTNLNNSINIKQNKTMHKESLNNKIRKFHKKEKSVNIQKHFLKNNSVNLEDYFSMEPETEHLKINISMRESIKNHNLINKSSANISYNNYCNDLSNKEKEKNNYSNKVTLNKMKIYKLNKSHNLSINSENKLNIFQKPAKKSKKPKTNKKEEINLDLNLKNLTTSNNSIKQAKKKFSFTKSKKFIKKQSEKDLKEMYLQAGTVQNEENNTFNHNNYTNSDFKLFTHNDLLLITHKNSFTNSGGETTSTNKNNNAINASSLEENSNPGENINNVNMFNPYLKSFSTEQIEKSENIKIYKNLWNEGYARYKQLINGKKIIPGKNKTKSNFLKLNFCMANDLIELKAEKKDSMIDIKNKFLKEFFKKKSYGEYEKKYIKDNILFLRKEGVININKKALDYNLYNNEVIIPVLKDMT